MNQKSILTGLSKNEKFDIYISLIVILFFGILILYYSFPSSEITVSNSIISRNNLDIEKITVDKIAYVPITKKMLSRKKTTPVDLLPKTPISSIKSYQQKNDVAFSSMGENKSQNISFAAPNEQFQSLIHDSLASRIPSDKSLDSVKTTLIDTSSIINNSPSYVTREQKKQEDCIIIIGAFGNKKNISDLENALTNDGYNIFSAPYKSLLRVGIKLPCNKSLIEKELKKIQAKYANDAMVLRKEK